MTLELTFTPSGRISIHESEEDRDGEGAAGGRERTGARARHVRQAFESSTAAGLFALASQRTDSGWAPAFVFWRDFAARYLSEICQTPEGVDAQIPEIPPPRPAELTSILLSVPPMPGAEYLSTGKLEQLWRELDAWLRNQVASHPQGLSGFLQEQAPVWHQVGRVCFHLAENRRDPVYPFAFLATYAPSVTGAGRVQYQPLRNALQQYAARKTSRS